MIDPEKGRISQRFISFIEFKNYFLSFQEVQETTKDNKKDVMLRIEMTCKDNRNDIYFKEISVLVLDSDGIIESNYIRDYFNLYNFIPSTKFKTSEHGFRNTIYHKTH